MSAHKRTKTKRRVRCTICTAHRWMGNSIGRFNKQPRRRSSKRFAEFC